MHVALNRSMQPGGAAAAQNLNLLKLADGAPDFFQTCLLARTFSRDCNLRRCTSLILGPTNRSPGTYPATFGLSPCPEPNLFCTWMCSNLHLRTAKAVELRVELRNERWNEFIYSTPDLLPFRLRLPPPSSVCAAESSPPSCGSHS